MIRMRGNRGQLWTSTLSLHTLSPHLDFPEENALFVNESSLKMSLFQEILRTQNGRIFTQSRCSDHPETFENISQSRFLGRGCDEALFSELPPVLLGNS